MVLKCSIFFVKCQWHLVGLIGVNLGGFLIGDLLWCLNEVEIPLFF